MFWNNEESCAYSGIRFRHAPYFRRFRSPSYVSEWTRHGGFAPAGRALGEPKSKLSRRIALLEERLGVRLIQRSTRSFLATDIGQSYYAHCKAMLVEADAAQAAVEQSRSEPSGVVRLTCPAALLHAQVSVMLAGFMAHYPIALRSAALAGVGVVHLALLIVSDEIRNGQLVHLLPNWAPTRYVVHAVYPSRRGLLPSVRALLDYLGARFGQLRED